MDLVTRGSSIWCASDAFHELTHLGQNLPKTDLQHGDDIGLAYVYALIQQWQQNQTDDALLFRAIIHLRYMMDDSPNAAVELILMRLYRLIGELLTASK